MRDGRRVSSSRAFWLPACGTLAASALACETVVVSMVEVTAVEVVPSSITLVEGQSGTASAIIRESGGVELSGASVTWSIDDPGIASVSAQGIIEGRAPGTTVVRASSG